MQHEARHIPRRVILSLGAGAVFLAACSLSPFRLFTGGRPTVQPPIELRRCDDVQDVLCLITFGIEPPDEMLILLLTVPDLPENLEIAVTHNDEELGFACIRTAESPTVVYCTGPQIPLGSTVLIEVFAVDEEVLLASGEFTLTAFALPTVPAGGLELPTPGALIPGQATRTPIPGGTPLPGTAYPNTTAAPPRNSPPISPP